MMKTIKYLAFIFILLVAFTACSNATDAVEQSAINDADNPVQMKSIIVDVRTPEEWVDDGHSDCSVNYPLDKIENYIDSLRNYDKVIVVCRSGSRAGTAKGILEQAGIKNIENKGSWKNIVCK